MSFKQHITRELTPRDGASYYLDGTLQGMLRVRMYVYLLRKYSKHPDNLDEVVNELTKVFNEPVEVAQEMVYGFFDKKLAG